MRRSAGSARSWAAVALLVMAIVLPHSALSQGPPLTATIFLPPGTTRPFQLNAPKPLVLQITNTSGNPITTRQGFSGTDFFRLLRVSGPQGLIINAAATIHKTDPVLFCLSRLGVLQSPGIPVAQTETLASNFSIEYDIPDLGTFYPGLNTPGRYTVSAVIPLSTFASTINDCDQVPGQPVVNVGTGAVAGRQDFSIVSNTVEFFVGGFTFVGFESPLGSESSCSALPCLTSNFGNTIPVKFQLSLNNVAITNAVALISVNQMSGTPVNPPGDLGHGSLPINQFRVDSSGKYVFNLDTSVLAKGVWQIVVSISDGSKHTAQIRLR